MTEKITSILITGRPGVGKTTIIQKIIRILQEHQLNCAGFYTEEVRFENGIRMGFDVVSLDGKRAILAREHPNDNVHRPHVGKYSVYVKEFEDIALPSLKVAPKALLIIDEIGKMELLSEKFKQKINDLVGKTPILATVPKGDRGRIEFVERLKTHKSSLVVEVTKPNRNDITDRIYEQAVELILE